ncbi:MAG: DUF4129 domain-containing transglutaminase family protein [Armatimonadota bacterium]
MRAERSEYLTRVGPLLLAAAVACSAAAGALTNTLNEPQFELLLHTMVAVGVAVSTLAGARGWNTAVLGLIVFGIAIAALTQRVAPVPVLDLLYPPEVVADEDLTWATVVAWVMVGFCFMLSRRQNVLFAVVSGLAIFGLVATINLNSAVLIAFTVYVFAMVFIWGYEHLLNVGEGLPHDASGRRDWLYLARIQALASTMLVAVLLAVALALGSALYLIGPRLYVGPEGMMRYARWIQVSLLSYGGMLNDFYVGQGPVNLPATPAIEVRADRPALWRGAVFDFYTGNGWSRELPMTQPLQQGEDDWLVVPHSEALVGEPNRQVVTLLSIDSRAMYAAATPARVRMTKETWQRTQLRHRPQADYYGALMTAYRMIPGTKYEVISIMPPTDAQTLRAAPADYPDWIRERYIEQMQVQAEAELGPLVERIVADAATPYDKVEAIRHYLGTTCLYTERAPAVPRGEDAAVFFVTSRRRGACDLFATALAVMARLAGVPARVATGFQTGAYDPEVGAYIPLQRDAHAWAEIYFPTIGWVPFDVAAGESRDRFDLLELLRSARWQRQARQVAAQVWRVTLGIAVVLALLSAVLGPSVVLRWLRSRTRSRTAREQMGEVFEWFRRRAAKLAGLRPERWQTPAEVRQALAAAGLAAQPGVRQRLDLFVDRFYDLRYGRREPSEAEVRRVRTSARRLLSELRSGLRQYRRRKGGRGA